MTTGGTIRAGLLVLGALFFGRGDEELFENGDFEAGTSGWRTLDMSGSCRFESDKKVKNGGKKSLRIEKSATGKPDFLKQSGELESSDGTVRFSVAYRVEKKSRLEVQVYFFDAGGNTIGKGYVPVVSSGATRGFEVAEEELEVPENAKGFGVNAILREPGTVWLDDVSAVHVTDSKKKRKGATAEAAAPRPFVLANGDFDADLDGWSELGYGSGTLEAKLDRRRKSKGKSALELERKSPRLFPPDGVHALVPTGGQGKRASLSFSVAAGDAARPSVCLQARDEHGRALATARVEPEPSEDFERGTLEVELPDGTVEVAIVLSVSGRGSAWFDEVSIKRR